MSRDVCLAESSPQLPQSIAAAVWVDNTTPTCALYTNPSAEALGFGNAGSTKISSVTTPAWAPLSNNKSPFDRNSD